MCLAVPGKIVTIVEEENLGLRRGEVDFAGICKEVRLDYIPEARVGDYVLVHVGFTLTVVDEHEAQRTFEALRKLDQLEGFRLFQTSCCKAMDMNDQNDANEVRPPTQSEVNSDARGLTRDWEVLFWAFLLFGLARLAWLYLYRPANTAFNLGLSCGFVFCGALGFLMRWVFNPKRKQ